MEVEINKILPKMLASFAKIFIGVKEVGGNNRGEFVSMFQKAVDGKAQGEAWCAAFSSFCIKNTSKLMKDSVGDESFDFNPKIELSESTCNLWFKNPTTQRLNAPEVGCLMIWRHWKNGLPTWQGHIGIVVNIIDSNIVQTVEGNTSSDGPNDRDGDGVFLKNRAINRNYGTLKLLGFLKVY